MSNFKPNEVVVFSVKLPDINKIIKMKTEDITSSAFTVKCNENSGKESVSYWRVYCNFRDNGNPEVSLYIELISGIVIFDMECKVSMRTLNDPTSPTRSTVTSKTIHIKQKETETIKLRKFESIISHEELYKRTEVYAPNGKVHFIFEVYTQTSIDPLIVSIENLKLIGDYEELFASMRRYDVTIVANDDVVLKAHKAIICARSPVFDKMFSTGMKETLTGKLNIIEFDSVVINELLRFIYCGKVENIADIDIDLYNAAEKYDIKDLKSRCMESILKRLNTNNAVQIVDFAHRFNIKNLKISCCLLIELDFSRSKETSEWKQLIAEFKAEILEFIATKSENSTTHVESFNKAMFGGKQIKVGKASSAAITDIDNS